jgi:hypothetical protein
MVAWMDDRIASCRCGQLSARCAGEPVRISVCHCLACKRRTGSAFAWNATWPEAAVTTEGRSARFTRAGDSGNGIVYDFCPECGSTVFYRVALRPGTVSVPVGAFADPGFPAPRVEIYEESRPGWCRLEIDR